MEYVLNQHDLWADAKLAAATTPEEDEDEVEDNLEKDLADLDVALFSLIEPLDSQVEELATILDDVLKDSLWKRTLVHVSEAERNLDRALLTSRAGWLWRNTTVQQRKACFFSGLGRKPGLFIHEQLDTLVDVLSSLQAGVAANDSQSVADASVQLAQLIMPERFFSVRRLPENWETVLADWVKGKAFSEILSGRKARDAQRTQVFVQDGVVFRLVWAAEAARVQAIATDHPRQSELGDGTAFVLTYGVPTIPAALLCQKGFASRTGALWVTEQLTASFKDTEDLQNWLRENDAFLDDSEFWESEDHYLMWRHASVPSGAEYPRHWSHKVHDISVKWSGPAPDKTSVMRIIPGSGRTATVCGPELSPLGTAQLPFDPHGAALNGQMEEEGRVRIQYFGTGG